MNKKPRTKVSKYLYDRRRAMDITLAEMVKITGLSQGYLSDLEHSVEAENPSLETLRALCKGYDITSSVFFN